MKVFKVILLLMITINILGATDIGSSPVKIQSDRMKYFGKDKYSHFIGNVVAFNDEFTLTADNVTVYFTDNSSVERIVCFGNVNFKTQDIVSLSNHADVNEKTKITILTGNAKVWQGDNFLEGERVVIHYQEDRIEVDKGKDSQVFIIFKPEDKGKKPDNKSAMPKNDNITVPEKPDNRTRTQGINGR